MADVARQPPRPQRPFAGKYEIVKLLGRGGMAEVFLVQKVTSIGAVTKSYALKRILPQFAADPMRVNAFYSEIELAAKVDHPNVIHVHDWGQDEDTGILYLQMDLVRGLDLSSLSEKLREDAAKKGARYPGQERGVLPLEV